VSKDTVAAVGKAAAAAAASAMAAAAATAAGSGPSKAGRCCRAGTSATSDACAIHLQCQPV
jgi:hypothetical protein